MIVQSDHMDICWIWYNQQFSFQCRSFNILYDRMQSFNKNGWINKWGTFPSSCFLQRCLFLWFDIPGEQLSLTWLTVTVMRNNAQEMYEYILFYAELKPLIKEVSFILIMMSSLSWLVSNLRQFKKKNTWSFCLSSGLQLFALSLNIKPVIWKSRYFGDFILKYCRRCDASCPTQTWLAPL